MYLHVVTGSWVSYIRLNFVDLILGYIKIFTTNFKKSFADATSDYTLIYITSSLKRIPMYREYIMIGLLWIKNVQTSWES